MRTSSFNRRRKAVAGFTLVELMVVVAIIGILAGIALVSVDVDKKSKSVRGFTDRVASQYELARQRAVATQKRQRLVITSAGVEHWQADATGLVEPNGYVFVSEISVPRDTSIAALSERLHTASEDSVPSEGTGLPFEVDLLPDGRARSASATSFYESGWTIFVGDTSEERQARALLFGLTGTSTVYDGW